MSFAFWFKSWVFIQIIIKFKWIQTFKQIFQQLTLCLNDSTMIRILLQSNWYPLKYKNTYNM